MENNYTAEAIEVLNGLDPVKQRPGMYTETSRPNHLGQEVIDNSVDEAIAGAVVADSGDQIVISLDSDVDKKRGTEIEEKVQRVHVFTSSSPNAIVAR